MRFLTDIISLVGLVLLGYGVWLYEPRLSYIVVGGILLVYGTVGAWRQADGVVTPYEESEQ